MRPWRPPVEQPLKYEWRGATPYIACVSALPATVISWMPTWAKLRMACQSSRPLASSANDAAPPSCPASVAPAANPSAAGRLTAAALPPENPPPPLPRKRPFQFDVGSAIHIRTLSPAGGCVTTAVTRQTPGLSESSAADSMVVFGSAMVVRLSHERTGLAPATSGFGVVCISGGGAGPPPAGGPPRPRWPCASPVVASSATSDVVTNSVRFTTAPLTGGR